jgi:hypothetical protein
MMHPSGRTDVPGQIKDDVSFHPKLWRARMELTTDFGVIL